MSRSVLSISLFLFLCVQASLCHAAVSVNWKATANNDWLYDFVGGWPGDGSYGTSWFVQLVADTDNDNATVGWNNILNNYKNKVWALTAVDPGDNVVSTDTFESSLPGWNTTDNIGDTYAGQKLYVMFFNGPSIAAATQVGIVYDASGTNWVSPAVDAPATLVNIFSTSSTIYGTIDAGGGSFAQSSTYGADSGDRWHTVPVPEPGTWGLMAMGLGMMLFAARKRLVK